MSSAPSAARAPTDWGTPRMQARIRRRYRAERRFRLLGLGALALAGAFLIFLLGTIVADGISGFQRAEVRVNATYDPVILGIDPASLEGPAADSVINRADFAAMMEASTESTFGAVATTDVRVISDGAWLKLRRALRADPERLGQTEPTWVAASTFVNLLAKDQVDLSVPEALRPVSDEQVRIYRALEERGLIRLAFNTTFLSVADSTSPELAGVWGAAKGSLLTMLITLLISFPIGVATAIYLEEYAPRNRVTDIIEVSINNLAAVPSIIFGLLGLAVFLNFFGMPRSAPVVGGLTLALMTLPVIVIAGRVSIKSVPPSIRDAALGVGASPLQVVTHHVLPLAMPGIMTGTIIGMARALGETAPLLMIGMRAFVSDVPSGVTDPATVLPVQIFLWSDEVGRGFVEKTSAAIMVLLAILMAMNGIAIYLRNKFERRW